MIGSGGSAYVFSCGPAPTGACCDTAPGAGGACDTAPGGGGDGVVDILDLLDLLGSWGPCS